MFEGQTAEGVVKRITAQVCDVNKALVSVHKIVSNGNVVVFSQEGSYIEDPRTKEKTWLKEGGGMCMLKMWVPASGFPRQGP